MEKSKKDNISEFIGVVVFIIIIGFGIFSIYKCCEEPDIIYKYEVKVAWHFPEGIKTKTYSFDSSHVLDNKAIKESSFKGTNMIWVTSKGALCESTVPLEIVEVSYKGCKMR